MAKCPSDNEPRPLGEAVGKIKPPEPMAKGEPPMEGAQGASDATSGGGAGSGIPDAGTQMRTRGRFSGGNPDKDRERIFPESGGGRRRGEKQKQKSRQQGKRRR